VQILPFCLEKNERWYEIDTLADLIEAELFFSDITNIIKDKSGFIFDLDGTVYIGDQLIDGAEKVINKLIELNYDIKFLSNNSSKNRMDYVNKLKGMSIKASIEQIVLSTDIAGEYLKNNNLTKGYIIGTKLMKDHLSQYGIKHTDNEAEFVLIGYDTEIDYSKMERGSLLINNELPYFATHADLVCPTPKGPIPDAGSIIELFLKSTGRYPKVFGKPEIDMVSSVINKNLNKRNYIFIGDRLYTDYKMAMKYGLDFICVLSGETQRKDLEELANWPCLVLPSIKSLLNYL